MSQIKILRFLTRSYNNYRWPIPVGYEPWLASKPVLVKCRRYVVYRRLDE